MGMGGKEEPDAGAADGASGPAAGPGENGEIDVRRVLGPDYCPELRVREGLELARTYEAGRQDDPAYVIWQASLGETARECLYDLQGNLTLRIGVSGRVVTGPKGGPGTFTVPLRIAVVKYKESVLHNQLYPVSLTVSGGSSAVFREVYEITVPSPGSDRDYLIYVGYDEGGKRILGEKEPEPPPVKKPAAPRRKAPAKPRTQQPPRQQQPAQQSTPNVLPVPEQFTFPQ